MQKTQKVNGIIYIHTIAYAAIQYIEKIISETFKQSIKINWKEQEAGNENMMKARINWEGYDGAAEKLVSNLRGWEHLRFEITQNPSGLIEGGRWMHTPTLGIFYQIIDNAGNALIPEQRIKTVIETGGSPLEIREKLELALGTAWDNELEAFRMSDSGVKWIFN